MNNLTQELLTVIAFILCCTVLHFDKIPLYGVLILSFGSGTVAAILVHFVVSPYLKTKILREVYGDGGRRERTLSGTSHGGVSFSKSPTLSEPRVNTDNQDITGKLICCISALPGEMVNTQNAHTVLTFFS